MPTTPAQCSTMVDCVVGVAASTAVSLLFFDHHPRLSICHAGLGLGDNEDSLFPSIIEFNTKHKISDVQTGDFHTAAVTELGVVFVWGAGFNGSKFCATACMRLADQCTAGLGHGGTFHERIPRSLRGLQMW